MVVVVVVAVQRLFNELQGWEERLQRQKQAARERARAKNQALRLSEGVRRQRGRERGARQEERGLGVRRPANRSDEISALSDITLLSC